MSFDQEIGEDGAKRRRKGQKEGGKKKGKKKPSKENTHIRGPWTVI